MIYTNKGLVTHAENALKLKTKYMWGGLLREITPGYIQQMRSIYGVLSGTGYTSARYKELYSVCGENYYGVDCVGLIKSYYWSGKPNGGTGSPKYGAPGFPDINANMMYNRAKKKGKIDTLPETPGLIVYCKSHPHVGIYIGNGHTIESTLGDRGDGVVKRKLDRLWEYWFECPYIDYTTEPKDVKISTTLDYNAIVREFPTINSTQVSKLYAGSNVTYIKDSDNVDPVSKLTYVKLSEKLNGKNQWILKQTIHGGA